MYVDTSTYLRPPKIGAASGYLLCVRLLQTAPTEPSERVLNGMKRMRNKGEKIQDVLRERARLASHKLRPYDREFDGSWLALRGRVQAHTLRPGDPRRARAERLLADLLPQGLRFLNFAYAEQWFYGGVLLERIDAEPELAAELDELAGPGFVSAVRQAHEELGEALGLGEAGKSQAPSLAEALHELALAIADYARLLAGEVDSHDEDSVAAFMAAMAPRDAHLAAMNSGKSSGEPAEGEGVDPFEVELPDLPAPPST